MHSLNYKRFDYLNLKAKNGASEHFTGVQACFVGLTNCHLFLTSPEDTVTLFKNTFK